MLGIEALQTTFNPNFRKIHLDHWDNAGFLKQTLNRWVNLSQFVISTFAISNKSAKKYSNEYLSMSTRRMKFREGINKSYMHYLDYSAQKDVTLFNRGLHLASIGGLYALHQYSKNSAYGLIGAMVVTKIASNFYTQMDFSQKIN